MSMHACVCVCAYVQARVRRWQLKPGLFLKSLQQRPQSFSDPDPTGHDLPDSGTRVSRCPARGPSRATVVDDIRVEGSVPLLRAQLCLRTVLPREPCSLPRTRQPECTGNRGHASPWSVREDTG